VEILTLFIFEFDNRQWKTNPLYIFLQEQQEVYTQNQIQLEQEVLKAQKYELLVQIPFHGFHVHKIPASFSPLFKRYDIYA